MPIRQWDIQAMLETNYKKAVELMPEDLSAEFQRKIIPPGDLKEYTGAIMVAVQFKDAAAMLRIQNWMAERFNKGGFGRKLLLAGIDPNKVYEQLLKGFMDY